MISQLAMKPPAFEKILFVDGIGRSGKKLTCRIVSNLERVEYFQFRPAIEMICHLHGMATIPETVAGPLLRTLVDEAVYARVIGRDLNTRQSDESSILNAFDSEEYLRRSSLNDGQEAVDRFTALNRIAVFHVHRLLPTSDLILDTFPEAKIIHATRHPVDLAEDWLQKGHGRRVGEDPLTFSLMVETGSRPVPWFVREWAGSYLKMSEADRCIEIAISLQKASDETFRNLTDDKKKRVFRSPLEHLLNDTQGVIEKFAAFVGTVPHSTMPALLAAQNCPCGLPIEKRRNNFRTLERASSAESIDRLLEAGTQYESQWNLEALGF